jgi:hypothetical protein
MRRIVFIPLFVAVAACAPTLGARHTTCMDTAGSFGGQVDCMRNQIAADPYMRDDPLVREYMMTGELLAAEVQRGRLDEENARLQFLQKLNDIEAEQRARSATEARINRDMRDAFPRQTTCVPTGNGGQQCTTY